MDNSFGKVRIEFGKVNFFRDIFGDRSRTSIHSYYSETVLSFLKLFQQLFKIDAVDVIKATIIY